MNQHALISALSLITLGGNGLADSSEKLKPAPDMLRFVNHDTLHGHFLAFGPSDTLIWNNPEASEAIHFSTSKVHRVLLNRGKAHLGLRQTSHVKLINGDIISGEILSADSQAIVMDTEHLGNLAIQRSSLTKIAPTPFGGKLVYYGPLNTDGWTKISTASLHDTEQKNPPKKDDENTLTDWQHIGSSWYSGTDKNRFLIQENIMPDQCRVSFKLAWRGSLNTKIALHADFSPPQSENTISSQLDMGSTIGHGYMLSLSSHSASLYACTFDEEGKPINTRLRASQSGLGLSSANTAHIELRMDKSQKNILLFLNGEFKTKWDLGDEYAGKGAHLAFKNQHFSRSDIRISDIVITHWNGMKDSAKSMKSTDHDVLLLNNGLDRFSGKLKNIREGKVYFQGSYGNELIIPMEEVSEITLASNNKDQPAAKNPKDIYFHIYPYGRITGVPDQSNNQITKLQTKLLGEVDLNTRYVNIIDFSHKNNLLDNWDDNF